MDSRWNIAFTEALNRRSGETRVHPYDYMRKLDHAGLEARRKELYDTFWKPNGDLDNPAPHWFSAEIRDEHDEVPFVSTANNIADFFTKPMKNSDSFYKWRALIMNEPARGDDGGRIPRATDSEHLAAVRAPSQAAAVAASQVEPAPLSGTLVRGGASESESSAARALSEKQCNCISSVPCTVASRVPPGRNVPSVVQSSVCRI